MSRKYIESKSCTGYSSKKVESKFGMKMMAKMGWTEYINIYNSEVKDLEKIVQE